MNNILKRIDNDFVYHAPKEGQPATYAEIRERCRLLAVHFAEVMPESAVRELSLALTKLEEAAFWANAGIARHG